MKTKPQLTWTISRAALEFGLERQTLRRRLADTQQTPDAKGRFTTRQICRAAFGDLHAERLRKTIAERRLAEAAAGQRERELLSARNVVRAWDWTLQTARSRWLQFPPKAALAFPTWADAKACEAWLEQQVGDLLTEFATSPDYNAPDEILADAGEQPAPIPHESKTERTI